MHGLKRFLNIVFALSGIACLAILALTWYGPWTKIVSGWMRIDWVYMAVQVLLAITVLGLLAALGRGLFARKPQLSFKVTQQGGTEVTITRDAVASLATKIIESDGTCVAEDISVAPKRGGVSVSAKVRPISTLDVLSKSAQLNDELYSGLAGLVGDKLKGVSLVFSEPETEHYVPASMQAPAFEPAGIISEPLPEYSAEPAPLPVEQTFVSADATQVAPVPADLPEQSEE